jgi:hypothetical protein
MMAQEHFFSTTKRFIKEFGPGHRIVGVIALFVVAMFGAAHWLYAGSGVATTRFRAATATSRQHACIGPIFPRPVCESGDASGKAH